MTKPGLDFELRALVGEFNRDIQGASQVVTRETARMNTAAKGVDAALRGASTGGVGRFGTQIQMAGYQVGDFAVQLASGQRPLTAFIQQGSQLAGAFGPWGAVIGAAGAVVGALATALLGAGAEAESLEDTTGALGDAIRDLRGAAVTGAQGLDALVQRYGALDGQLIGLIQRQTQFNLLLARGNLRDMLGSVPADAQDMLDTFTTDVNFDGGFNLAAQRRLQEVFGVSATSARELEQSLRDLAQANTLEDQVSSATALGDALSGLVSTDSSRDLVAFAAKLNDVVLQVREYEQAAREAGDATDMMARPLPELNALAASVAAGRSGGGGAGVDPFVKASGAAIASIADLDRQRELVGLTAEAQARLNIEYETGKLRLDLLNKARESGNEISDQERALVDMLAQDYRIAAEALLSAQQAQDAMTDAQKAAKDAAEANARAIETIGNQLTSAVNSADSFEDALKKVAVALANVAAQAAFGAGPLGGALNSALGVASGGLLGYLMQPSGGAAPAITGGGLTASGGWYANGAAFAGGRVTPFATGGVVSSPTLFPMAGGRMGLMGEAGAEGILPLKRINGRLGVEASGGGGTTIVVNAPGATAETVEAIKQALARLDMTFDARALGVMQAARTDRRF